jgi:hypothetical protein
MDFHRPLHSRRQTTALHPAHPARILPVYLARWFVVQGNNKIKD